MVRHVDWDVDGLRVWCGDCPADGTCDDCHEEASRLTALELARMEEQFGRCSVTGNESAEVRAAWQALK